MTENMDNFTDDDSPKAGGQTGSAAIEVSEAIRAILVSHFRANSDGSWNLHYGSAVRELLRVLFDGKLGWKIVPRNPTHEMERAYFTAPMPVFKLCANGRARHRANGLKMVNRWQAMYEAAPTPALQAGTPAQAESPGDEAQGQKP